MIKAEATPYKIDDWVIFKLPKEASDQLTSRGQVMAKGTINGQPFHTALEPDGNWGHWLPISQEMQRSAEVSVGQVTSLEFEQTKDWPEPAIPADWQTTLDAKADVRALWDRVTPMARWEWLRWIGSTKSPETRLKRIDVSCDKLLKGERRPCCFNRNMCTVPYVSKNGILLEPAATPV